MSKISCIPLLRRHHTRKEWSSLLFFEFRLSCETAFFFVKTVACQKLVVSLQLKITWTDLIDCNHKKKC